MSRAFCGLCATALAAVAAICAASNLTVHAASPGPRHCILDLPMTPAACSRMLQSQGRRPGRTWRADRPGLTLAYASQLAGSAVSISSIGLHGFTPVGQLGLEQNAIPFGVTVDAARNLYVAISTSGPPATAGVDVFPPRATQPSRVYTAGLVAPVDVAVDRHGTLYVANLAKISGACGQRDGGDIVEYAKGSLQPTAVIKDLPGCPHAVALDAKSNLYISYAYYGAGKIALESDVREYAYGATSGRRLHLQDASKPPGYLLYGIAVDSAGSLVVAAVDTNNSVHRLLTFAAGKHKAEKSIAYASWWSSEYFALRGNRIFAPAYVAEDFNTAIAEFEYPSGRQLFVQNPTLAPGSYVFAFAVSP